MAKNDYHVIMYRILAYIYACLREGVRFNPEVVSYETLDVPESYWTTIVKMLIEKDYIRGAFVVSILGEVEKIKWVRNVEITPEGIEFFEENSRMGKAKSFLRTLKDTIPGL